MSFEPIKTGDDSPTFFSEHFGEAYHSTSLGAYSEALHKHVLPPFLLDPNWLERPKIRILDICFGLGYNTLVTLKEYAKRGFGGRLEILSPEMDRELLSQLGALAYPSELAGYGAFLEELIEWGRAELGGAQVELYIGEARECVRGAVGEFDLIYQDAFSPKKNPELWTLEYFKELRAILAPSGFITTYTQSSAVRYTAHLAGFEVYAYESGMGRGGTIFALGELPLERIDLEEKRRNNPSLEALLDEKWQKSLPNS